MEDAPARVAATPGHAVAATPATPATARGNAAEQCAVRYMVRGDGRNAAYRSVARRVIQPPVRMRATVVLCFFTGCVGYNTR
jgi:hypothetical protein